MNTQPNSNKQARRLAFVTIGIAVLMVAALGTIWTVSDIQPGGLLDIWYMFLVGTGAAIIANSTGVGGGVVFLPAFEFLGSSEGIVIATSQIVGMSFIIQSFGMTTGSLTWLNRIYRETDSVTGKPPSTGVPEREFWTIIFTVLAGALPAMLLTQRIFTVPPEDVLLWFKLLSILLGMTLLLLTLFTEVTEHRRMEHMDRIALIVIGLLGGAATAFFSVGVGELLALYLFIRNFPLVTSAATAVIVSSVSVMTGAPWHLANTDLPWGILILVIPGAILGGWLARRLAYMLGAKRLKIMASVWIVGSSLYLIMK